MEIAGNFTNLLQGMVCRDQQTCDECMAMIALRCKFNVGRIQSKIEGKCTTFLRQRRVWKNWKEWKFVDLRKESREDGIFYKTRKSWSLINLFMDGLEIFSFSISTHFSGRKNTIRFGARVVK